jgi:hypothetical protein
MIDSIAFNGRNVCRTAPFAGSGSQRCQLSRTGASSKA